jgi:hypothetical protein
VGVRNCVTWSRGASLRSPNLPVSRLIKNISKTKYSIYFETKWIFYRNLQLIMWRVWCRHQSYGSQNFRVWLERWRGYCGELCAFYGNSMVNKIWARGGAVSWGTALQTGEFGGSIPDGVIAISHWNNPSGRIMALLIAHIGHNGVEAHSMK